MQSSTTDPRSHNNLVSELGLLHLPPPDTLSWDLEAILRGKNKLNRPGYWASRDRARQNLIILISQLLRNQQHSLSSISQWDKYTITLEDPSFLSFYRKQDSSLHTNIELLALSKYSTAQHSTHEPVKLTMEGQTQLEPGCEETGKEPQKTPSCIILCWREKSPELNVR